MSRTVVILAAGAGSRLGEIGRSYSKAMVPLHGRPLLDWVVGRLRAADLTRVILVAHADDVSLQTHARDIGAEVTCQQERRGIADALWCAAPLLSDEASFVACACDSLFQVADLKRLLAVGRDHRDDPVIAVQEVAPEATAARSAVLCEGEFVRVIVEKPDPGTVASGLIALPLYLLPRRLLARAATTRAVGGECYLSTALADEIRAGGRVRWVAFSERLEVTSAEDVARVEKVLAAEPGLEP